MSLLGSAYLMAAAIGPYGHPLAAWFALFPLFVSICVLRPWQAGLAGWLWGGGVFFFAYSGAWFAPPQGAIVPGWLAYTGLILTPGVYAVFAAGSTQRIGFSPFVLGVGWLGVELMFRGLGLKCGLGAALQSDGSLLQGITYALGSVFVGFIIAYVNALCVTVVTNLLPSNRPRRRPVPRQCSTHWGRKGQRLSIGQLCALNELGPRAPPLVRPP